MDMTEEALAKIVEENYDSLYRFCRSRVRTDHDAFDIVQ